MLFGKTEEAIRGISTVLDRELSGPLITIDSHTAGEATRLILSGFGPVNGRTMAGKLEHFKAHQDWVRLLLTREPRGHRELLAAAITEPVTPGARFGLIYMDAKRYPYLCGHATIGAVTTLIEAGLIEPEPEMIVDTPSGPMTARVRMKKGAKGKKVESVAIEMVPAFVHETDRPLNVPGWGMITVDTVCAGGFFAMVDAAQIGMKLIPENAPRLIELGMKIIEAANRQLTVCHPERPEVTTVDVTEFYDAADHSKGEGKSAVIYGQSHMDRSPCGTGTAAKLALLHHRGWPAEKPYINRGALNTAFEARITDTPTLGPDKNNMDKTGTDQPNPVAAVTVEIRASAHITGLHRFYIDPEDPFPEGFLL